MKPFVRKFLGVVCAVICLGMPISALARKMTNPSVGMGGPIIDFIIFGILAWILLFKKKGTNEKQRNENNPQPVAEQSEEQDEVQVGVLFSILVYFVDAIIVLLVYALPSIIVSIAGGSQTLGFIMGLIGFLAAIAVGILLPGPKRLARYLRKKQQPEKNK